MKHAPFRIALRREDWLFDRLSVFLRHAVADADFREDILGVTGIFFDFTPDVGHIDPQNLVVVVRVRSPDPGDDGIVGQHPPRIFGEQGHEFVLYLRQMDILFIHKYDPFVKIDYKVLHLSLIHIYKDRP